MGVNVANILGGPMDVFEAPVGTIEPTEADNLASVVLDPAWRDCGGSNGGLKMAINQSFGKVTADQTVDILASMASERSFTIGLSLLEGTMLNMKMLNNGGAVASGALTEKFEPITNTVATPPTYRALLCRGVSAVNGRSAIFIARKVLNTANAEFSFVKDNAAMFGATFTGHYVSSVKAPFAFLQSRS